MKKIILLSIFLSLGSFYSRDQAISCAESKFQTVTAWVQACKKISKNKKIEAYSPFFEGIEALLYEAKDVFEAGSIRQKSSKEFLYILNLWKTMMVTGSLSQKNLWAVSNTGQKNPKSSFYEDQNLVKSAEFQPYVQKILANPNDQFYVHGDLHGDIDSLVAELEYLLKAGIIDDNFRIISDTSWFLFLGDYVDRGNYGLEVIYTLLRLSLANPDRVILVRGNHEESQICDIYGFKKEVMQKFGDHSLYASIIRMYDLLPIAFYLGVENNNQNIINYIQCCHGGLEVGYDPKSFLDSTNSSYQLLGNLYSPELLEECDQFLLKKYRSYAPYTMRDIHKSAHLGFMNYYKPLDTMGLGFLWTDFNILDTTIASYNFGRGFEYGSKATEAILNIQSSEHSKIRGIIRAHQHADAMMKRLIPNKGVYKMWRSDEITLQRTFQNGLVWTLNVAPHNGYGKLYNYDFHTFVKITVQKEYDDWSMQVFNLNF